MFIKEEYYHYLRQNPALGKQYFHPQTLKSAFSGYKDPVRTGNRDRESYWRLTISVT